MQQLRDNQHPECKRPRAVEVLMTLREAVHKSTQGCKGEQQGLEAHP
jgi:hypothetical protein